MSYVYVVQNHLRYDPDKGETVPCYDVSPAEKFGELRFLLSPTATLQKPAEAIAKMDMLLNRFCDDDYLLLIGNPAMIGWATAIAAAHNEGRVQTLVWSSRERRYRVVRSLLPIRHLRV